MRFHAICASCAASLLALSLTACGDSGAGVISTPAPTPTPTPTPTSTFPLTASTSFQTTTGTLAYTVRPAFELSPASVTSLDGNGIEGRSSTVTFAYDAPTGTYSLSKGSVSAAFAAGDRGVSTGYNATYAKSGTGVTDKLTLYGNVPGTAPSASPPVVLGYASYGAWLHTNTVTQQNVGTYFVFGQSTGAASMPTTGTATYQATGTALDAAAGASSYFNTNPTVTATLTADFAAANVSTALNVSGIAYSGSGSISGDQFGGILTSSAPQFAGGGFVGGFFGPAAKEMGYTFWINHFNPDPFAGASAAPSRIWITGAVVGAKP